MFCEFINLFRRYCGLKQQDVADAAGLSLDRYRAYEYGLESPDDETLRKLEKVYGLKESVLDMSAEQREYTFAMFEPRYADDNIFATAEDKAKVKMMVNLLDDDEERLLLLYRTASEELRLRIMQTALNSDSSDTET